MNRKFLHLPDTIIILCLCAYALLDFFVIPRNYETASALSAKVTAAEDARTESTVKTADAKVSATSYSDENISIEIRTYRVNGTTVYAADVRLSSIDYLKTAFAGGTCGRNITASTSEIADSVDAIFAVNGDFYGARESGYVIRNGVLYRSSAAKSSQQDLAITSDGSFMIINESEVSAEQLQADHVLQVLSFGPALLENGEITAEKNTEVAQAKSSNPRTVIAQAGPLHYIFAVADGRTDESEGLSLYEIAQFMQTLGAVTAYNLDGGGSSTMVFNGNVINCPTSGGRIRERSVSDIVYIGLS